MIGTLLNATTAVVGGVAGTLAGGRLPERMRQTIMHGIGLAVLLIGAQMALTTQNVMIVLGSIVVGGIIGELLDLDAGLLRFSQAIERRLEGVRLLGVSRQKGHDFTRGFVSASLLFCVGPMTIVGSIQDGLTGDYRTLAVKSMLDGFAGLALAASYGIGVAFSAITVLVYQGALTLAASWLRQVLDEAMIREMSATGGLLIIAIGLMQLEVLRLRVANLLPALAIAPLFVAILGLWS